MKFLRQAPKKGPKLRPQASESNGPSQSGRVRPSRRGSCKRFQAGAAEGLAAQLNVARACEPLTSTTGPESDAANAANAAIADADRDAHYPRYTHNTWAAASLVVGAAAAASAAPNANANTNANAAAAAAAATATPTATATAANANANAARAASSARPAFGPKNAHLLANGSSYKCRRRQGNSSAILIDGIAYSDTLRNKQTTSCAATSKATQYIASTQVKAHICSYVNCFQQTHSDDYKQQREQQHQLQLQQQQQRNIITKSPMHSRKILSLTSNPGDKLYLAQHNQPRIVNKNIVRQEVRRRYIEKQFQQAYSSQLELVSYTTTPTATATNTTPIARLASALKRQLPAIQTQTQLQLKLDTLEANDMALPRKRRQILQRKTNTENISSSSYFPITASRDLDLNAGSCPSQSAHSFGGPKLAGQKSDMDHIKSASRIHLWHWNEADKSDQCIVSRDKLEVCFHPQCSESAAAIRGSEPLVRNGNYYYWEITVFDKAYGTSVMFGVCTKDQPLHVNDYCNLVGLDKNGWSLSHKGLIWHNGKHAQYTQVFPTNQTVTIGILFNTMRGELSYFMDGKNLGVAFQGLNNVNGDLYPVVGSTAKCTRMRLESAYCGYVSLLERSCFTILKNARDKLELIKQMHNLYHIPIHLIEYLAEAAQVCGSQTQITAKQSL